MSRNTENDRELLSEPTGMSGRAAIARRVSCWAYQTKSVPQGRQMQIQGAARAGGWQVTTGKVEYDHNFDNSSRFGVTAPLERENIR